MPLIYLILRRQGFAYSESWIKDVVEIDGHKVEESLTASGRHGVAGVVNVSPSIGALRETASG